tara:strand:+ start:2017 stop:2397 length:381 start_codon:yes stop_codon:yes gene_type:complete
MSKERAIDKLKKAFNVEERNSYSIFKGEDLILKIYWTPITIADRDAINNTLKAMNKGDDEGSLDFALQTIINKAQDEEGKRLFSEGDTATLKREIPLSVLLDIMSKMNELGEGGTPDAVKSTTGEG